MCDHEYFQELSALATIGQTSPAEDRELAAHLRECAECSDVHFDFIGITQRQLPHADPIRWRIKMETPTPGMEADIRARFVARARVEGIDFGPEEAASPIATTSSPSRWKLQLRPTWTVAAVAACALFAVWAGQNYQLVSIAKARMAATSSVPDARENEIPPIPLPSGQKPVESNTLGNGVMSREESASRRSQQSLQKQLDEARQQLESLSASLQQTEAEKNELLKANREEIANNSDLRTRNDNIIREEADILASRVMLEQQVRTLSESLQEKTVMLERENQLMAISKDVRQLMGARNLLIMDVHDVGGGGKSAKAFGRVFYAEGQSLIFYAFDLPSGGLSPAKYTFQAWGQKEPGARLVRNLGTFEVDDHEQRRWVLKVNDPVLLSGIDSVFVTAEPIKDGGTPRGRKLMYAYILGQPNHP